MTSEIKFTSEIKVRLIQKMGGDYSAVAAAKVSTTGEEALLYNSPDLADDNRGLINYMAKMRHGTPVEHCVFTVFAHAPIFVWREWHRHRIMSYNEESARYKQLDPVFYLPPADRPMLKVDGWKPGRPKFLPCEDMNVYQALCENLKRSYKVAYEAYEHNLALGIDPGLARDCLPVGIYSSCWVTANLRSFMNFLSLRTHNVDAMFPSYPLYEMEVAARQVEQIFADNWPLIYESFVKNGRVAP